MDGIYRLIDLILPIEPLRYDFMKNAFLAVLLMTPLLALLGTMTVNRQMAFFSDALGHSALTGIGLGIVLGVHNDLLAMLVFGIVWALLICWVRTSGSTSADTVISVFASTSIAAGLLILSRGGQFAKYSSLLIGDITAITQVDLIWLLCALVAGITVWVFLFNPLLMTGISNPLAHTRRIRTKLTEAVFMVLIAIVVMMAIRMIGVMLINALLVLPAAAGRNISRNSRQHAVSSILIALLSGISGLFAAYAWDTSAGAAIVLCAAVCFAVSLLIRPLRK